MNYMFSILVFLSDNCKVRDIHFEKFLLTLIEVFISFDWVIRLWQRLNIFLFLFDYAKRKMKRIWIRIRVLS